MKKMLTAATLCLLAANAMAWSGYDYENGTYVEIEKGNLVRQGRDIEIYDYRSGYREVEVESIRRSGSRVEIEVKDQETGEMRTLEMDGR